MSKARELADLGNVTTRLDEVGNTDGALSSRNLIINGGLTIWQRGTSHAAGSGINYTADRFWRYNPSASGTIERSTDVPNGFEYSLFFNVTGGGNNLGTGVEFTRQGFFPQQMYTLSMYLKGDFSGTSIYINYRNSAGSGTNNVDITTFNSFGNYSDWTRVTIPVDTTGITPNANNLFMNMEFGGFPNGGKITGVQLEVGDTATPFEHRSYGDELARCQRYFWQLSGSTASPSLRYPLINATTYGSGTACYGNIKFPQTMRSAPSFSASNVANFKLRFNNDLAGTSATYHGNISEHGANIVLFQGTTTLPATTSGWVELSGSAVAKFDAEL